jgi:putative endopeptidase
VNHRSVPRLLTWMIAMTALAAAASDSSDSPTRFGLANIDRTIDPCEDFYQYACGGWLAANPRPADEVWWSVADLLQRRNESLLRDVVERDGAPRTDRTPNEQLLGDYFAACMDETRIEADGLAPLRPELDRIAALRDKRGLATELARLHRLLYLIVEGSTFPTTADPGSRQPLFGFSSAQDYADSSKVVAVLDQGGLGMPDRDYYLCDDAPSGALRAKYVAHVREVLLLAAGGTSVPANAEKRILAIEMDLARSWMDGAARIDKNNLNHRFYLGDLEKLMPTFAWRDYLAATGAPASAHYLVAHPGFFGTVDQLLRTVSLDDWKLYLRWHLLSAGAPMLGRAFAREDFAFNSKALMDAEQPRPRWKTCLRAVDRDLSDALGPEFVAMALGPQDKERAHTMATAIRSAMRENILGTPWMTEPTQREALAKADNSTIRIGYPDVWRDYSKLTITRQGWLANAFRASEWEFTNQLAKIGRPPDRNEWWMSPTTIDAYHNAHQNSINVTAGMLGPPFFDRDADIAVNFGDLGALEGHELTHGFDAFGRHYDHDGNLRDWWAPADALGFKERAECVKTQFSRYVAVDDVKVNGQQTLAENIADIGGVRIALTAMQATLREMKLEARSIDGYTPEQRFFLSYALGLCGSTTPSAMRASVSGDRHSPPRFRVNGVFSDMPEFQSAFGCKVGQPMVQAAMCPVW